MAETGKTGLDWSNPQTMKDYQTHIGLTGDQIDGKPGTITFGTSIGKYGKTPGFNPGSTTPNPDINFDAINNKFNPCHPFKIHKIISYLIIIYFYYSICQ